MAVPAEMCSGDRCRGTHGNGKCLVVGQWIVLLLEGRIGILPGTTRQGHRQGRWWLLWKHGYISAKQSKWKQAMRIRHWRPATLGLCARDEYSLALARRLSRWQGGVGRWTLSEGRNREEVYAVRVDFSAPHFYAYWDEKARFHQEGTVRCDRGYTGSLYLCLTRRTETRSDEAENQRLWRCSRGQMIKFIKPIRKVINLRHIQHMFWTMQGCMRCGLGDPWSF